MKNQIQSITDFIHSRQLSSISLVCDNDPYSFNAFYAFDDKNYTLIIASDDNTKHMKSLLAPASTHKLSGTIVNDTKIVGLIQGVQFLAEISKVSNAEKIIYFKKFPFALAMKPKLWAIKLNWIKFTNNKLGFGKKIIWER